MIDTPHNNQTAQEGDQPQLTIEKWVYGGAGLGRLEGRVALVPFVLPGEKVLLSVGREKASMLEGRVAGWLEKSEKRVDARCPYFEKCGGCHYQHAPYELQLEQKVEIVREVLKRVGRLDAPTQIDVVAGEPWSYRNRSQFHLRGPKIGYLEAGSHNLVAVDQCPISAPLINDALAVLTKSVKDRRWPRFLREVELFTNGEKVMINVLDTEGGRRVARGFFDWLGERIEGAADGYLDYQMDDSAYRVSHNSFFQVNRFLVGSLVETALAGTSGETALDLYSGVGLFTLPLSRRFARVDAVETSASAVRDLEYNVRDSGDKVHAHRAQAEQYLESLNAPPDFVVADPPRSGLGKGVVKHLARLKPPRINIVSCDPATLARDLGALIAAGYEVAGLTVVDLFPQTYHIECVARLELHS